MNRQHSLVLVVLAAFMATPATHGMFKRLRLAGGRLVSRFAFSNQFAPFARVYAPIYQTKARNVISNTRSLNKGLPEDRQELLSEMIADEENLALSSFDTEKALAKLDAQWIFPFLMNHLGTNCGAKFYWEFIKANEDLLVHRTCLALKCYITETEELKQHKELKKVTSDEFSEKLNTLSQSNLGKMKIKEAAILAKVIQNTLACECKDAQQNKADF